MSERELPNVLALPLDEALDVLAEAGVRVRKTIYTSPPGAGKGEGQPRVVQQLPADDMSVDLTIAFERQLESNGKGRHARAPRRPQ